MSNILEISNLSINFATRDGSFKAVDDISFNIENNKTAPSPITKPSRPLSHGREALSGESL